MARATKQTCKVLAMPLMIYPDDVRIIEAIADEMGGTFNEALVLVTEQYAAAHPAPRGKPAAAPVLAFKRPD